MSLQRVAKERIADVCDRAFEDTFRNDPRVYVVRSATCRIAVLASGTALESRLADQWGARLCSSVVRTIAHDKTAGVQFENQATFVSDFLSDYIAGSAWDHWYYGAFRVYREHPAEQLILSVLEKNREYLGEILMRLRMAKALDAVLSRLGIDGQRRLWLQVARGQSAPTEEPFRIFVHEAFRLLDALTLWAGTRPSELDFLRSYLRLSPSAPDWTDVFSLASAVAGIINELAHRSHILPEHLGYDDISRLDDALDSSFDWLDKNHLKNSIISLMQNSAPRSMQSARTLRPFSLTPSQKQLLTSLAGLIRDGRLVLDPRNSGVHANLARILSATAELDSSAHSSILSILESIAHLWHALSSSGTGYDLFETSQNRKFNLQSSLSSIRPELAPHIETLLHCGEPASQVLEALMASSQEKAIDEALESFASPCAGLFLLTRTVRDLRLVTLLKDCGLASCEPLLAAIAARIAGPQAISQRQLDRGASLWAGIVPEEYSPQLNRLETLNAESFFSNLLELLEAQHLIDPYLMPAFPEESPFHTLSSSVVALVDYVASSLIRTWARWLPGVGSSSVPYLLEKFIRRPGRLFLHESHIDLQLAPGPLDSLLKMAGYLDDTSEVAWMGNRFLRFRHAQ